MNMIRTTISLREDVYENIRRVAMVKKISMSDVVNAKLTGRGLSKEETETKIKDEMNFFNKLAKMGDPNVDVVAAVREMRDKETYE